MHPYKQQLHNLAQMTVKNKTHNKKVLWDTQHFILYF